MAAFWNVTRADYINYDDSAYITGNINIQKGITPTSIKWAFTTGYQSNWHPLTWISHMLDFQLFGLNPHGTHIVNLLFHITNALLLLFIFYRLTGAVWRSAFVAALFALHPLHVQSVAWASERKDVLSTFFFMLTVIAYCRHTERPTLKRYIMIILFFTLGLMAKPMLVSLPFVLLLLDYWPLQRFAFEAIPGRNQKRFPVFFLILEKIPLFLLAALSSAVTYMVQKKGGSVYTLTSLPLTSRLSNAFVSYMIYIQKTIWPNGLAVFYPFPKFLPKWEIAGAVVVFSLTTLATLLLSKRFKYLTVGWFWYLITLVPVIGLVQAGAQARADRYTYVPLIGLFIMAAWGIPELTNKLHIPPKALAAPAVLALACLSVATWDQAAYWQNSMSLFGHAVKVTNNNYLAYTLRGNAYKTMGDNRRAIQDYNTAIKIKNDYYLSYYNRAFAYSNIGDYAHAVQDYKKTLKINPKIGSIFYFYSRGYAYEAIGNYVQASSDFSRVAEIAPRFAQAYVQRAIAYSKLGYPQKAYADMRTAAALGNKAAQVFLIKRGVRW
ncbi:MAG: tetratricopeptide repeat protein [Actinomycetota bacterium]|nr:tetratricopeptide repeat protein [Actinomycetota bacterium]